MPIFEYTCESCSRNLEILIRSKEQQPSCPECGSSHLRKKHSLIATPKKSSDLGCPGGECGIDPAACGMGAMGGGCGGGMCGM